MVSTRRSRSAGGESEQIVSTIGSQDDVSSKHAAAQPLDPISEEPAAPTPARRRRGVSQQQQQQQLAQIQEQQQQQRDAPAHDLSEQAMKQQLQVEPAAGQQQSQPPIMQQPSDDSSSEEEDDDLDFDFDGPGVLQNLAAAIRSGFHSQGHQQRQAPASRHQQQKQPIGSLQAAAAAAATAARSSGRELNDDELQQLRWRPHTGLQVPAQAAAAVALVRPMYTRRGQRQQQPQDEHIGALVESAPAAAADGAGASSSGLQQSGAAAAAGSKPAGLSKALHAPTLDAAARAKESKKTAPDTAGSKWFDLSAPKITEELKRDLRVLRLRGAYDTKRFYKSFDNTKFPKYFAVS
jgi:hypothetical protein